MADETGKAAEPVRLQFHYIKGPSYHEVACHGAIGGPTPQNKIWMALFSERYPLPRVVEFQVASPAEGSSTTVSFDERSAMPTHIETRSGIIRHVEFSTYFDLETAERLRDWLNTQIAQLSEHKNDAKP
jgi:hypothetical protein